MPAPATARSASPTLRRARTQTADRPRPRAVATTPRAQMTRFAPALAVGRTAVAVGGIADSGLVFKLTRGRLWIGLLATLLVGIVGLNVMALSFSASSSNAARQADDLELQNSALKAQMATLLSTDEVERIASELGLVAPAPGAYRYVKSSADDAEIAAKRLRDGEFSLAAAQPEVPAVPVTDPTTVPVTDPVLADPAAAPLTTAPVTTDPVATAPVETAPTTSPVPPATGVGGAVSP